MVALVGHAIAGQESTPDEQERIFDAGVSAGDAAGKRAGTCRSRGRSRSRTAGRSPWPGTRRRRGLHARPPGRGLAGDERLERLLAEPSAFRVVLRVLEVALDVSTSTPFTVAIRTGRSPATS